MKFLCDVHISYKLVRFLKAQDIEVLHVNELPDKWHTKDNMICQLADQEGFTVITKDIDFKNSHFLKNTPARLIRVALGNISNQVLIDIFIENLPLFKSNFAEEICFIEILATHINIVKP